MLRLDKQLMQNEQIVQQQDENQFEDWIVEEELENIKSIVIPSFCSKQILSLTNIKNKIEGQSSGQCSSQGFKKELNEITMDSFNIQQVNQNSLNKTNNESLKIAEKIISPKQAIIIEDKKFIQNTSQRKGSKFKTQTQQTKNNFGISQNIQINQTDILSKQPIILSECNQKQQTSNKAQQNKQNKEQQKLSYRTMFDKSIIQKIQKVIFGKRIRKNEYLKKQGLDPKIKEKIEEQVFKSMDILQVYKELIFLKKAILILLSKEQLAALKFVGCSSEMYLNQIQNSKIKENNYFEEQVQLLESNEQQIEQIMKFLQKCKGHSKDLSKIDQRILSSLCINFKDDLIS
ncbi:hypothetical protein ABPG73_006249 [Tetrahymena malaccensis]